MPRRTLHQPRSMTTPLACAASASRSSGSEVSTVPSGSANATTSASMADPLRASRRKPAARRASASGAASATSQVSSNLFSFPTRLACHCRHPTNTTAGTIGGHNPSPRLASPRKNQREGVSRSFGEARDRTRIEDQHRTLAGLPSQAPGDTARDASSARALSRAWLAHRRHRDHSARSAVIGCTLVARRAGSAQAAPATNVNSAAMPANVNGS